jgi:hypothetical protein
MKTTAGGGRRHLPVELVTVAAEHCWFARDRN